MSASDPFSARAEVELRGPIRHLLSVRANHPSWGAPIPLNVISGTVTFDERSFEHITASLRIAVSDAATLALLDPRIRVQLLIDAGYQFAGGTVETHPLAVLDLRTRTWQRPADQVTLTAAGLECRLRDAVVLGPTTYTSADDAGSTLAARIRTFAPGSGDINNSLTPRPFLVSPVTITEDVGADPTQLDQDIQDRAGAIRYWNGQQWVICPDFTLSGVTAHFLTTGNGGTVTDFEDSLSRDPDFANLVLVRHKWDGGEAHGWASVNGGATGVTAAGQKARVIERSDEGTAATASAAASILVARTISRGRALAVEAAAAAYWLRPGMTVQTRLADAIERHLVSRVEFEVPAGLMRVITRQPTAETITTGA